MGVGTVNERTPDTFVLYLRYYDVLKRKEEEKRVDCLV